MAKSLSPHLFLYLLAFSCSSLVALGIREGVVPERLGLGREGQELGNECQLDSINALEPTSRIESEAGLTEFWDHNEDQFRCAGVAFMRRTIQQNGLLLPYFRSAPELYYVLRGKGIRGLAIPGCPETYQSVSVGQSEEEGRRGLRDQHQKVRRFRQGDVFALPAGVVQWLFNDGDEELVLVTLIDSTNEVNQLDQNSPRRFHLAGNPEQEFGDDEQSRRGQRDVKNIFEGFDSELLEQVFGLPRELVERIQGGQDDRRGQIVRAEQFRVIRPPTMREEEQWEERRGEGIRERRPFGRGSEEWEEERGSGGRGSRERKEMHGERGLRGRGSREYEEIRGERGSRGRGERGSREWEEIHGERGSRGRGDRGSQEWEEIHGERGQRERGSEEWEEVRGERDPRGSREYGETRGERGQGSRGSREWEEIGGERGQRGQGSREYEEIHGERGPRGRGSREYEEIHGERGRGSRGSREWGEIRGERGQGSRGSGREWEEVRCGGSRGGRGGSRGSQGKCRVCRCKSTSLYDPSADLNGVEETICSARLRENIDDPSGADIFIPQAGRLTTLNSFNLPVLGFLGLSAEKGTLYRNAIMAPHWNLNAHSVIYGTRGSARVQIVNERGEDIFHGVLRENQVVVAPQNFVLVKQAGDEGFEWVSFKTNDNALIQTVTGRVSALRALPVEVVMSSYQISREQAERLKLERRETVLLAGGSRSGRDVEESERRAIA